MKQIKCSSTFNLIYTYIDTEYKVPIKFYYTIHITNIYNNYYNIRATIDSINYEFYNKTFEFKYVIHNNMIAEEKDIIEKLVKDKKIRRKVIKEYPKCFACMTTLSKDVYNYYPHFLPFCSFYCKTNPINSCNNCKGLINRKYYNEYGSYRFNYKNYNCCSENCFHVYRQNINNVLKDIILEKGILDIIYEY